MRKLFSNKRLPIEKQILFKEILANIKANSRFELNDNFIQHGKTTVKMHCIAVAYTALFISYRLKLRVNEAELIRGALLHDYFLYDWHERSLANMIHGYTHPGKALKQAMKDFDLSDTEKDMIKHHMFPLTITPPKTTEGKILCLADKLVATKETIFRN